MTKHQNKLNRKYKIVRLSNTVSNNCCRYFSLNVRIYRVNCIPFRWKHFCNLNNNNNKKEMKTNKKKKKSAKIYIKIILFTEYFTQYLCIMSNETCVFKIYILVFILYSPTKIIDENKSRNEMYVIGIEYAFSILKIQNENILTKSLWATCQTIYDKINTIFYDTCWHVIRSTDCMFILNRDKNLRSNVTHVPIQMIIHNNLSIFINNNKLWKIF